jgi:hypothetical protein
VVIDFFGGEKANVVYLLKNPTALVLRGDPETTQCVITNLDFTQRFCSGCMSFNEPLSVEKAIQHIDEFEAATMAGLPENSINTLWVRHTDKERTELHFLIPQVDTVTGRQMTIYLDRRDRQLMNGIRDVINIREGYTRPDDPARKRTTSVPLRASQSKKDFMAQLDANLQFEVAAGRIKDRRDVVRYLEDQGLIVKRSKKGKLADEYLKVKRPNEEKFTGLRGAYYRADFTAIAMPVPSAKPVISKEQELEEATARLKIEIDRRAYRQCQRHAMAVRANERRTLNGAKEITIKPAVAGEMTAAASASPAMFENTNVSPTPAVAIVSPIESPKMPTILEPKQRQDNTHDEHRITNPFSTILDQVGGFASRTGAWFGGTIKNISHVIGGLFKPPESAVPGAGSVGDLSAAVDHGCLGLLRALGNLDRVIGGFEDADGGGRRIMHPSPQRRPPVSPLVSGPQI